MNTAIAWGALACGLVALLGCGAAFIFARAAKNAAQVAAMDIARLDAIIENQLMIRWEFAEPLWHVSDGGTVLASGYVLRDVLDEAIVKVWGHGRG